MNIAEMRRPQDGQFTIKSGSKNVDIRVATAGTAHGERATLRILDKSLTLIKLENLGFLPETMSDSIFPVLAEETGFLGSFVLIFLFLVFTYFGFKIAKSSNDKFLQLAGFGITSWITLQAFVNIGAMIGIVPLTGIPLPFISYGGSAIVVELIGVGILLNISKHSKNP